MSNLKSFVITLRETTITTRTHTTTIEARTEEHARILAEYADVPSYSWAREREGAPVITVVQVEHAPSASLPMAVVPASYELEGRN